jgi:hypothetical protein
MVGLTASVGFQSIPVPKGRRAALLCTHDRKASRVPHGREGMQVRWHLLDCVAVNVVRTRTRRKLLHDRIESLTNAESDLHGPQFENREAVVQLVFIADWSSEARTFPIRFVSRGRSYAPGPGVSAKELVNRRHGPCPTAMKSAPDMAFGNRSEVDFANISLLRG